MGKCLTLRYINIFNYAYEPLSHVYRMCFSKTLLPLFFSNAWYISLATQSETVILSLMTLVIE